MEKNCPKLQLAFERTFYMFRKIILIICPQLIYYKISLLTQPSLSQEEHCGISEIPFPVL